MAALQRVEKIDLEGLEDFKKSLICTECKKPPRAGDRIFTCASPKNGEKCDIVRCDTHSSYGKCKCGYVTRFDPILTKFVALFKFCNCKYLKNGCQEELEAKDLEVHEKICLFRDVTCPKLFCYDKIVFNGLLGHFQGNHSELNKKNDVLEFKGSLEDSEKSTFILECYGMQFFPQFYKSGTLFHFWVIGQGDQDEIHPFEV